MVQGLGAYLNHLTPHGEHISKKGPLSQSYDYLAQSCLLPSPALLCHQPLTVSQFLNSALDTCRMLPGFLAEKNRDSALSHLHQICS